MKCDRLEGATDEAFATAAAAAAAVWWKFISTAVVNVGEST